jgi:hypothetical protein
LPPLQTDAAGVAMVSDNESPADEA